MKRREGSIEETCFCDPSHPFPTQNFKAHFWGGICFICLFLLVSFLNPLLKWNGTPPQVSWQWVLILQGVLRCCSKATQCRIKPPKGAWFFTMHHSLLKPYCFLSTNRRMFSPLSQWKHSTVETNKFVISFFCFLISWQQNQSLESFKKITETNSITKAFKIWNPRKLISASF